MEYSKEKYLKYKKETYFNNLFSTKTLEYFVDMKTFHNYASHWEKPLPNVVNSLLHSSQPDRLQLMTDLQLMYGPQKFKESFEDALKVVDISSDKFMYILDIQKFEELHEDINLNETKQIREWIDREIGFYSNEVWKKKSEPWERYYHQHNVLDFVYRNITKEFDEKELLKCAKEGMFFCSEELKLSQVQDKIEEYVKKYFELEQFLEENDVKTDFMYEGSWLVHGAYTVGGPAPWDIDVVEKWDDIPTYDDFRPIVEQFCPNISEEQFKEFCERSITTEEELICLSNGQEIYGNYYCTTLKFFEVAEDMGLLKIDEMLSEWEEERDL